MRITLIAISALLMVSCGGSNNSPTNPTNDSTAPADNSNSTGQNTDSPIDDTIASTSGTTSTGDPTAAINSGNYLALLTQAFDVFSGRAYDERLNSSEYVSNQDELTCESGSVNLSGFNLNNFNDCVIQGEKFYGTLNRSLGFDRSQLVFTDFNSDIGGAGSMRVDGTMRRVCCVSGIEFHGTDLDYNFNYSGGSLTIANASTYKTNTKHLNVMGGSFSIQATTTNNKVISVATGNEFQRPPNNDPKNATAWEFESGTLIMTGNDGSKLVLNADTGDVSTVNITLSNTNDSGNDAQIFTQAWAQFKDAVTWASPVEVQSLHRNAGKILNVLAGDDLEAITLRALNRINHATNTAISRETLTPVESVTTPISGAATTTTTTISTYQCSDGGTLIRSQRNVSFAENDGFFNLSESTDSDAYDMNNCVFFDAAIADHQITLNGRYEQIDATRSGRKHSQTSNSKIWQSFRMARIDSNNRTDNHFADAELQTTSYNNDGERGNTRTLTITDYEHINDAGVREVVEASKFMQSQRSNTNNGQDAIDFEVSAAYTGRLTDHHKVDITTVISFGRIQDNFGPPEDDNNVAANGQFSMDSANGDTLVISMTGEQESRFYTATFDSVQPGGPAPVSVVLPFYQYKTDGDRFFEVQR